MYDPQIDPDLVKAYNYANYTRTLENQKELLRVKTKAKLHYAAGGGLFYLTPDLIVFVKAQLDLGRDNLVLLDKNENPILIEDLQKFFDSIVEIEQEVMNGMYVEYTKLKDMRNLEDLLDDAKQEVC